jgi:hypothetical protein
MTDKIPISLSTVIDATLIETAKSAAAAVAAVVEKDKEIKAKKKKMVKWPEGNGLPAYKNIISPLKHVLDTGYKLIRKNVKGFEYEGYNIGEKELLIYKNPKDRLTEKSLEKEDKFGIKLIDVVLNITFLLGMEQGRRAERSQTINIKSLLSTLEKYRKKNKDLRLKIDELTATLKIQKENPTLSDEEFSLKLKEEINSTRQNRIEEIKKELNIDETKSFQFKTPTKSSLKELRALEKTLPSDFSIEQWENALKERGWTLDQWFSKNKKKSDA